MNIKNATVKPRDGYVSVLSKITEEKICPFCEHNLLRHHPKPILFKNKHWISTANAWPYEGTRHHFLLIARRHVEYVEKLTAEEWKALGLAQRRLTRKYKLPASSLFIRSGDTRYTGATVNHLHAQLLLGAKQRPDSKLITPLLGFGK